MSKKLASILILLLGILQIVIFINPAFAASVFGKKKMQQTAKNKCSTREGITV